MRSRRDTMILIAELYNGQPLETSHGDCATVGFVGDTYCEIFVSNRVGGLYSRDYYGHELEGFDLPMVEVYEHQEKELEIEYPEVELLEYDFFKPPSIAIRYYRQHTLTKKIEYKRSTGGWAPSVVTDINALFREGFVRL